MITFREFLSESSDTKEVFDVLKQVNIPCTPKDLSVKFKQTGINGKYEIRIKNPAICPKDIKTALEKFEDKRSDVKGEPLQGANIFVDAQVDHRFEEKWASENNDRLSKILSDFISSGKRDLKINKYLSAKLENSKIILKLEWKTKYDSFTEFSEIPVDDVNLDGYIKPGAMLVHSESFK